MGAKTSIEWTDATWNPVRARWTGAPEGTPAPVGWHCEHVSEGCRNCYAEVMNRRLGTRLDFKPGNLKAVDIFLDEEMLLLPLRWTKPRMIFVGSMTDLFADFVTDDMLDRIFAVMALTPHHTYQLLTKRPERMRAYVSDFAAGSRFVTDAIQDLAPDADAQKAANYRICGTPSAAAPLANVWLGTSVEDQAAADARIPHLLKTPAAKRFLSCEPLLGPVDLISIDVDGHTELDALTAYTWEQHVAEWTDSDDDWRVQFEEEFGHAPGARSGPAHATIDWVIVGGESGANARPMHPDWARSLRDQCATAGVPFLFKQWGMFAPLAHSSPVTDLLSSNANTTWPDGSFGAGVPSARGGPGEQLFRGTKGITGRILDGVTHDGMPA